MWTQLRGGGDHPSSKFAPDSQPISSPSLATACAGRPSWRDRPGRALLQTVCKPLNGRHGSRKNGLHTRRQGRLRVEWHLIEERLAWGRRARARLLRTSLEGQAVVQTQRPRERILQTFSPCRPYRDELGSAAFAPPRRARVKKTSALRRCRHRSQLPGNSPLCETTGGCFQLRRPVAASENGRDVHSG
jgi:hypothetical protein